MASLPDHDHPSLSRQDTQDQEDTPACGATLPVAGSQEITAASQPPCCPSQAQKFHPQPIGSRGPKVSTCGTCRGWKSRRLVKRALAARQERAWRAAPGRPARLLHDVKSSWCGGDYLERGAPSSPPQLPGPGARRAGFQAPAVPGPLTQPTRGGVERIYFCCIE